MNLFILHPSITHSAPNAFLQIQAACACPAKCLLYGYFALQRIASRHHTFRWPLLYFLVASFPVVLHHRHAKRHSRQGKRPNDYNRSDLSNYSDYVEHFKCSPHLSLPLNSAKTMLNSVSRRKVNPDTTPVTASNAALHQSVHFRFPSCWKLSGISISVHFKCFPCLMPLIKAS